MAATHAGRTSGRPLVRTMVRSTHALAGVDESMRRPLMAVSRTEGVLKWVIGTAKSWDRITSAAGMQLANVNATGITFVSTSRRGREPLQLRDPLASLRARNRLAWWTIDSTSQVRRPRPRRSASG